MIEKIMATALVISFFGSNAALIVEFLLTGQITAPCCMGALP